MSFSYHINQLTAGLQQEYKTAYQQTLQQGSLNPLIQFYNSNESELNQKYVLSLNSILGINGDKLSQLGDLADTSTVAAPNQNQNVNPIVGLSKNKEINTEFISGFVVPAFIVLASGAGLFLIIKSLKK